MAKCKKEEGPPPPPGWMATFSDLNSLLMTFFVMLFSMSSVSPGKFQQAAVSFRSPFSGTPPSVLTGGRSLSEESLITSNPGIRVELFRLQDNPKYKGRITIEENDRGTIIKMQDMAFFEPGSARLTADAKELLYKLGIILIEHSNNEIEIYGFTDDRPPQNTSIYPSNWHLAAARAASVAKFYADEMKQKRTLERLADVKEGKFDPEYYYNADRFFPIAVGDKDIINDIENLKSNIEAQKLKLKEDFEKGKINISNMKLEEKKLEEQYKKNLEILRKKYRRIDLLILRQRLR
ncbi:flagellar motor protein MotB [Marinitoga sp. 1197]|uniref:flagellar motor protein MotB n=1 Tax=Marinitoga sp. 1197 TaxID=1428449 RepID=UPI0006416F37|nr:flagellar motor protein MotB [Marinitoga sp. 1197]KLO23404.1 flagellar motor protein MotB [Marinitoga sp. 1197]